jgi:hyaluronate lyase
LTADDGELTAFDEVTVTVGNIITTILNPEADATVRSGAYKDANYNNGTLVARFRGDDSSATRESFIRFNMSGVTGDVTRAVVRLSTTRVDGAATHTAEFVSDNSWGETTITWNNKPASSTVLGSWAVVPGGVWEMDVTTQVQNAMAGDKKLSLRVYSDSNVLVRYGSRTYSNSAKRPEIIIETR